MVELTFDRVSFQYPGAKQPALTDCSVRIPRGNKVAIIGRNGSGKSTFFLHCNGILQPSSGQIMLDGVPLRYNRADLQAVRQRVGIVFQQADNQLFSANIEQDISFGPLNLGLTDDDVRSRIDEVMKLCEITHLAGRPIHALSGGEKSRVALAGVLAMRPDLLLIDEPTATLDPPMRKQLFAILNNLHITGKTIIVATHEYEIARYWADFVVVVADGKVLMADERETVFANDALLTSIGFQSPWYTEAFGLKEVSK